MTLPTLCKLEYVEPSHFKEVGSQLRPLTELTVYIFSKININVDVQVVGGGFPDAPQTITTVNAIVYEFLVLFKYKFRLICIITLVCKRGVREAAPYELVGYSCSKPFILVENAGRTITYND